ncbi:MAG: RdgB/HAM1 family non-canonical purine NTP pyrophosphatase [Betaproteobacteria bacterium]|nr:MAG: RdgB/HAM1 family non-canonical purine NTP pyrophosphatase [Betaproteobacteria bacterium]
MKLTKLVIATGNLKKLKEFERLLAPLGIVVLPQSAFDVPEAPEPHCTFLENALAKARNAARHTGLPALADDSGICVDALNGAPGVNSAYYAGAQKSDADNNAKLIADLQGVAHRRAHYTAVLALVMHENDPEPIIAEGRWWGEMIDTPRGAGGFGYDPYFLDIALNQTAAEMPIDIKGAHSHRGRALAALLLRLQE